MKFKSIHREIEKTDTAKLEEPTKQERKIQMERFEVEKTERRRETRGKS